MRGNGLVWGNNREGACTGTDENRVVVSLYEEIEAVEV